MAATVALVAMIGVSTVVEAQDGESAPTSEQAGQEPATTTITIVVPVEAPAADESAAPVESDEAPAAAEATTATTAATEPPVTSADDPSASPGATDEAPEDTSAATTAATASSAPAAPDETTGQQGPAATSTTLAATATATHDAAQETVTQGTQVAVAVSGSNEIVTEQPAAGPGPGGGADVSSGEAAAIGSRDDNTITQSADVVLTGDAVARILQIALILNIGAALANSGVNTIAAAPTGSGSSGKVTTGDATAIGNDIASYVTQGATAAASNALDDRASQLAISMFLGLAIADTGSNSVSGTGVTGSGGGIATGDAMAIGNDSITDITQRAVALGADGARLSITQRATVLNLGFALANSGLNEISGVAGQLLAASDEHDDALAQDLFVMLLPALLQSYGLGVGSGSVVSGDATAIGNRSETYVEQVARATATGDGTAVIDQEVLVANVGAAGANTGGNVLGSRSGELDPQTASAVVSMAAFLAQLLSVVHQSPDAATSLAASSQTLQVPFGDLILQLDGSFDALDTTVSNGESHADIRQISIVVSLGVADANSGRNATEVVSSTRVLAAVNSLLPELIDTGDARAANRSLVVICQRINAADVECLAPPEAPPTTEPEGPSPDGGVPTVPVSTTPRPSVPVAPAPTAGAATATVTTTPQRVSVAATAAVRSQARGLRATAARQLPATGSDTETITLLAAAFVLFGAGLLLVRRGTAQVATAGGSSAAGRRSGGAHRRHRD